MEHESGRGIQENTQDYSKIPICGDGKSINIIVYIIQLKYKKD